MALKIRTFPDPVLREKCHPVEEVDREVKELIERMGDALGEAPGRLGLAAPQVGVLKRMFVYDLGAGARCLINPEIIEAVDEEPHEEGCLSLPGVYISLPRGGKVRARCMTPSGHRIEIEGEGLLAQLLQHECDHLEGLLIIDRCDPEERKRALEEYREMALRREQQTV